jgi:hypothetical protein
MIIVKNSELVEERFGLFIHAKLLIVAMIATIIAIGVHITSSIINLAIIIFSMTVELIKIPNAVTTRAYKTQAFHQIVKRRTENGDV